MPHEILPVGTHVFLRGEAFCSNRNSGSCDPVYRDRRGEIVDVNRSSRCYKVSFGGGIQTVDFDKLERWPDPIRESKL
jgi:hypothetical protein